MRDHLADALSYVAELEANPTPPTSAMHVWLMELARERAELLLTLAAELNQPDGGRDLGFTPFSGQWMRPHGPRDTFGLWPQWWRVYRDQDDYVLELREHGCYLSASRHPTARAAMQAAARSAP